MRSLTIDGVSITEDGPAYCIAEVGHNHQGSVEKATLLFASAKKAGFHAVKVQKRDNKLLYTEAMFNSPYNSEAAFGATYGAHREALELDRDAYLLLQDNARKMGVSFFATAFDPNSAEFLYRLGMPAYKAASGDLKNIKLLKLLASYGKPLIISTAGAFLDDVKRAYDAIMPINNQLAILQCTAQYPCGADNLHLRVIETYLDEFPDVIVGLSDHHARTAMAVAAYALGARIFEKHVTLDRTWKGTDHAMSLEPHEQEQYVSDLRRAALAMGSPIKRPLACEEKPMYKMGKGVYANDFLEAGEELSSLVTSIKSPAQGMAPWKLDRFSGKSLRRDVSSEEPLSSGDVE